MLKKVLVTGATSGIGAATVKVLAAAGMDVLAIARREDRLTKLAAEAGCGWLASDVRDTDRLEGAIDAFEPDILVNNAGVGHGISGLHEIEPSAIQEAFEINVIAADPDLRPGAARGGAGAGMWSTSARLPACTR